ncbi:ABC transporter permease [Kitasatospora sp. NBC_00240]|uniref:ABC transporter permease n=1 Tax=Kitasatospora sp. NBC_00240 TaxID=2903567 RepID=UPI002259171A|nr:ABC transporter permease [Kitasatospora sp. NBC_00240]MCX5212596.1 ABC transporter permease [Kitasatospora sp. NBC_00240]
MLLKTSLRSFLAHKGRMILSLIAVVLSVAFVSGTLVFSNTATSTFDKLFASTASDISVQPARTGVDDGNEDEEARRGKPATLAVETVQKVAAQPGVKAALGQIMIQSAILVDPATNKVVGPTTGAPTLAGNWTDTPRNSVEITSGHVPQGPGEIVLDADTAKKAALGLGSKLRVLAGEAKQDFTIAGIATFKTTNPGAALAFLDTPTAQRVLLAGNTAFTSVEVFGDGSRTDEQLKTDTLGSLGGGYQIKTAAEQKEEGNKDVGQFLDFMEKAMLGFAGISLLVGGFLIINTFSMLVAQRTREIGLLRAVGGSRRQVNQSVLIEALTLGVLGSTLGIGAGLGLALGLVKLMKAAGMNLSTSLEIGADVPIAGYLVGVLITVVAAWIPARRASRIAPIAALRDHGTPAEGRSNIVRTVIGLVLTGGGAALLVLAANADSAGTGGQLLGLGVLCTLIGFVVLGPLLATSLVRVLGALLPKLFGPSGKLAQRNAMRNPRRTGATAAALMIGLALVIGTSVFTASAIKSTSEQIDQQVGADFVIDGMGTAISAEMLNAARNTPGIDHFTEQRSSRAILTMPNGDTVKDGVVAVTSRFNEDFHFPLKSGAADSLNQGSLMIAEDFADEHKLKVGDPVKIDYGQGHSQSVPVGVVRAKGGSLFGSANFISSDTLTKAVPPAAQAPVDALYGKATAGADVKQTLAALEGSLKEYPQLMVKDQAGYKKLMQEQINTLLYMIYGLLFLSIVVAVLGVVNTLALSVVERTREIGLLRAIGLSRRQLRRMIRLESVVIALFGAVLGTGLGLAWGVTAQKVLAGNGLAVLAVPTTTIVATLFASVLIGLLAALVPAFRAGRMNVLGAIATD